MSLFDSKTDALLIFLSSLESGMARGGAKVATGTGEKGSLSDELSGVEGY